MTPIGYTDDALSDINPEAPDFRDFYRVTRVD
jgi:hypothetical protein